MASPLTIHTVPNCGLQLDCSIEDNTYEIKDESRADFISIFIDNKNGMEFSDDIWKGKMSTVAKLTLPIFALETAGIDREAKQFAFLHPPRGLADKLDWNKHHKALQDDMDKSTRGFNRCVDMVSPLPLAKSVLAKMSDYNNYSSVERKWAAPHFTLLGAYVYFDENDKILSINTLSLVETRYTLKLAGPFSTLPEIVRDLKYQDRTETISLDLIQESGFVESAWILPNETFQGKRNSIKHNDYGAFVFVRDNGSAVTYTVTPHILVQPGGDFEILNDIFSTMRMVFQKSFSSPDTLSHAQLDCLSQKKPIFKDQRNLLKKYQEFMDDIKHTKDYEKKGNISGKVDWENGRNIFHIACCFGDKYDFQTLLRLKECFTENPLHQKDEFQWTPLHYACRFRSNHKDLISLLLQNCRDAVLECDKFKRYPLHVACDSIPSEEVIALLLEYENKMRNKNDSPLVLQPTKYLKRLPLHIACNRGASSKVIKRLLEADEKNSSITTMSGSERIPLHIAIENKLSPQSIKTLLKALGNKNADILYPFRGMLPIHIACWKNYSDEIVELLLEKDSEGIQLQCKTTEPLSYYLAIYIKKDDDDEKMMVMSPSNKYDASHRNHVRDIYNGMRPLHLALSRGATSICELLLKEEGEKGPFQIPSLDVETEFDRYPLHIACLENLEENIIRRVFTKKAAAHTDKKGLRPLHYASDHSDAQINVIEMLIDSETKYPGKVNPIYSPLLVAEKAHAPNPVVELLLHENYFNLKGFSDSLIHDLSFRVKDNKELQRLINRKLSERLPFWLLYTDLVSKMLSFVCVVMWSEQLLNNNASNSSRSTLKRHGWEPSEYTLLSILAICSSFLLWREIVQLMSQRVEYFLKREKVIELVTISCMLASVSMMAHKNGKSLNENEAFLLTITGIFLTILIVIALRSTFLPFAKFAGGIIAIIFKLFPFFVMSLLVLLTFTFIYRVRFSLARNLDTESIAGEFCSNYSFYECFSFVLHGFFHGFEEHSSTVDIGFGVFVILILLTVVIAIVGEVWHESHNNASEVYWHGRLSFISEISYADIFLSSYTPQWIKKLHIGIDATRNVNFSITQQTISWAREAPFKEVVTSKQYMHPERYFDDAKTEAILSTHSIRSDIHWINEDSKRKQKGCFIYYRDVFASIWKRSISGLFYGFLVLLGCITGGFFWPRKFRLWVLSLGVYDIHKSNEERTEEDDVSTRLSLLEKEMIAKMSSFEESFESFSNFKTLKPAQLSVRRQTTGCDDSPQTTPMNSSNSDEFSFNWSSRSSCVDFQNVNVSASK